MTIAIILTLAALLVAAAGFGFAAKVRKPGLFKLGGLIAAAGIMLLWLLPWWAIASDRGSLQMPVMLGALILAISVLGLGLNLMTRAINGREESEVDRIIHNFDPYDESL